MSSSGAGFWQWNPSGLGMGLTVFCSKSLAWMKRPFVGAGGVGWSSGRPPGRSDAPAGWRPAGDEKKSVSIVATVKELVEPDTAGDPITGQLWVRSSLRRIRDRLEAIGHPVSAPTVGRLLKGLGYSLRVNSKKIEASSNHPDRDQQFAYIAVQRAAFSVAGLPILSVDTKKKELVGNFMNAGAAWVIEPTAVNVHDFPGVLNVKQKLRCMSIRAAALRRRVEVGKLREMGNGEG